MKVRENCLPGKLYLLDEREASVPNIVAKILDDAATISEFFRASCKVSDNKALVHPVVNPDSGKAIIWLELNKILEVVMLEHTKY